MTGYDDITDTLRRYATIGDVAARAEADSTGGAKTNYVDLLFASADCIDSLRAALEEARSEADRLRDALRTATNALPCESVVLLDDGGLLATDMLMDGDVVLAVGSPSPQPPTEPQP